MPKYNVCSFCSCAVLHETFGQTVAAQTGSPQDGAQDSSRRSGQQLLHQKRWPRDFAQALLQRSGEQCCTTHLARRSQHKQVCYTMLHKTRPRDLANNCLHKKKVAERCCTIFAPGIWRAMLHHKVGQMIAAQKGQPKDSVRRLGQQTAAPKRWPKDVAQDSPRRSGQQLLHQKRWPRDVAQALLQRSGEQCCTTHLARRSQHKQVCYTMLHKTRPGDLANNCLHKKRWPRDAARYLL